MIQEMGRMDSLNQFPPHFGTLRFAAANLVGQKGKVLAIEPDMWLVNILRKSSQLKTNIHLCVDVLPVAVSDSVGIAKFNIAKRGRAANYLNNCDGSSQTGGIREIQLVPTVSLDWLLDKYAVPNIIKIDVEGAEYLVLKGAEKMLSEVKPIILCEVSSNLIEDVSDILKKHGYSLYDAELEKENRKLLSSAVWHTLAYPPSHAQI
ncbi:MAG: FkbM family methyltransferase [Acidobacteriota bacterium]